MWKRLLLYLTCWFLTSSVLYSPISRGVFGVKVSIGPNSTTTTFVCFLDNGRVLTKQRFVDRDTFIKFISGFWPSIYNPNRINYFEEHDVDCSVIEEEITRKKIGICVPLDSLWKIRFATYPYRTSPEQGWSNKLHKPSPAQEVYLYDRYGVNHVDADYFIDTSFWLLIEDVMNPDWIRNYRSIK